MRIFQDTITATMLLNCQGVATETSKIADEDVTLQPCHQGAIEMALGYGTRVWSN